jgi:glycosyltransferase involved in cell wall biosynthesis
MFVFGGQVGLGNESGIYFKKRKMKIVYCIVDCSQAGGMERMICCKANYLTDSLGYEVTIITTDQRQRENFYVFSDKIKFIDLEINYVELKQYSFTKRLVEQIKKRKEHRRKLSNALKKIKADIVISTYTHEFTLLPAIQDGSKKIAEIHFSKEYNQIENQHNKQSLPAKLFSKMAECRKYAFIHNYNKFVVLTHSDVKSWEKRYINIEQIYNLLPFYPAESAPLNSKRIISVGRLTSQKGFDRLIEAFSLVNKDFSDWYLDIFGSGEDEKELMKLIKKYHLDKVVKINSTVKDIIKKYFESSIYVMSSRYEGFGMVLAEAMACGVPCVSFDCPHGPSEIITEGEDGFLVEDGNVELLAEKMKVLIADNELRKAMGRKAKENIRRFAPEVIMQRWNELFKEVMPNESLANK